MFARASLLCVAASPARLPGVLRWARPTRLPGALWRAFWRGHQRLIGWMGQDCSLIPRSGDLVRPDQCGRGVPVKEWRGSALFFSRLPFVLVLATFTRPLLLQAVLPPFNLRRLIVA